MKGWMTAAAMIGVATSAPAQAQQSYYSPIYRQAVTDRLIYFPMGTALALTTRAQLSTKDNKSGDRIYLEVAEPLTYRGQTVVPVGSVVVGEVAQADRNGHFGVKGKLGIRLLYIDTPTGSVRLTGQAHHEGTSGTALSVGTIAFVSVLGFLIHGTSAVIPAGSAVTAYLAEPMPFFENPAQQAAYGRPVQPDAVAKPLPAHFDPSVFAKPDPAVIGAR